MGEDFGGYTRNDVGGYQFMQAFPGGPAEFPSMTLSELLDGGFDPALLRDKIVLIGVRAEATPDFFFTALGKDLRLAGAAIHAFSISQLLRQAHGELVPLRVWGSLGEALWLWTVAAALALTHATSLLRLLLLILGGLGLLGLVGWQSLIAGWWLPLAAPAAGWVLASVSAVAYFAYQQHGQRKQLMQLFSRHVSKHVADVIWQARDQYLSEGRLLPQRLIATVLFTDLQGFTSVSEQMEPQELMDWLNEYMARMVEVVVAHNGDVNKFIGDAIMAVFGIPIPRGSREEVMQDATQAVRCALAMRDTMNQLNQRWRQRGLPTVRMRVGIYTGPLVAGSLGGVERQEYTVLGDTVNTASRLESYDKNLDADSPCRILISDFTLDYTYKDVFRVELVGRVNLKGKEAPMTVYRVLGYQAAPPT